MNQHFTSGRWTVEAGSEADFIEAWTAFASWASVQPGAGTLMLTRDLDAPDRFVSLGGWQGLDAIRSWKDSPEFRERMGQVLQHVSGFESRNLGLVATAADGRSMAHGTVAAR